MNRNEGYIPDAGVDTRKSPPQGGIGTVLFRGTDHELEARPSDLKERINLLLWVTLPPEIPLGDAEVVAVEIDRLISEEWAKRMVKP